MNERRVPLEAARRMVRRWAAVLRNGKPVLQTRGVRQWTVDLCGDCTAPFVRSVVGATRVHGELVKRKSFDVVIGSRSVAIEFKHRCNRCENCRAYAVRTWMARCGAEFRASQRTWFLTFTYKPEEDILMDGRVALHGTSMAREMYADVYGWLRLLRQIRAFTHRLDVRGRTSYLAVCELHDSEKTSELKRGRPHYHMLVHERVRGTLFDDTDCEWALEKGSDDAPKRVYRLKDNAPARLLWPFGHSKVRLCLPEKGDPTGERAAVYVCSYIRKDGASTGRVKASPGYGALGKSATSSPSFVRVVPTTQSWTHTTPLGDDPREETKTNDDEQAR